MAKKIEGRIPCRIYTGEGYYTVDVISYEVNTNVPPVYAYSLVRETEIELKIISDTNFELGGMVWIVIDNYEMSYEMAGIVTSLCQNDLQTYTLCIKSTDPSNFKKVEKELFMKKREWGKNKTQPQITYSPQILDNYLEMISKRDMWIPGMDEEAPKPISLDPPKRKIDLE